MRRALLATVAITALSLGGIIAHAQDRGGAQSPAAQSPAAPGGAASTSEPGGAARNPSGRAAQTQENRGAAQSGHETGQGRAEERRPEQNRQGAAEGDRNRNQAQEQRNEPNRQGAAEGERNRNQAQEQRGQPNRQGAAEGERNRNQAQDRRGEPNRQGAAEGERNRNQAQEQRSQPNRQGATEGERNRNQAQDQRGQQNQPGAGSRSSQSERNSSQTNTNNAQRNDPSMQQNQSAQGQRRGPDAGGNRENERAESRGGNGDVNVTGSITVDRQKASQVHDELIRSAPRENINVSINVGSTIPQRVRVRPVPQSIVAISPEFRGYDYVVVRDEIVIVEPRTKKVVTIIRSSDNRGSRAERAAFSLNMSQKSRIRRDIRMGDARNVDVEVREGRPVPQTVVLESLPDVVVRDIPEVRRYRYFVDERRIILVDPDTREVVDIIE